MAIRYLPLAFLRRLASAVSAATLAAKAKWPHRLSVAESYLGVACRRNGIIAWRNSRLWRKLASGFSGSENQWQQY
jgi:hypothetical protein